ncbi:hypothetical protein E2C01_006621 [Portunus trituberculatus]|uniref:Uncharacterized protein n=1 Tax=Portunus trituberculatus TaxID=210409 RepID=A0A5B7CVV5_PORTR|nr:hypothetical protein [Portunus trituberculatus]
MEIQKQVGSSRVYQRAYRSRMLRVHSVVFLHLGHHPLPLHHCRDVSRHHLPLREARQQQDDLRDGGSCTSVMLVSKANLAGSIQIGHSFSEADLLTRTISVFGLRRGGDPGWLSPALVSTGAPVGRQVSCHSMLQCPNTLVSNQNPKLVGDRDRDKEEKV